MPPRPLQQRHHASVSNVLRAVPPRQVRRCSLEGADWLWKRWHRQVRKLPRGHVCEKRARRLRRVRSWAVRELRHLELRELPLRKVRSLGRQRRLHQLRPRVPSGGRARFAAARGHHVQRLLSGPLLERLHGLVLELRGGEVQRHASGGVHALRVWALLRGGHGLELHRLRHGHTRFLCHVDGVRILRGGEVSIRFRATGLQILRGGQVRRRRRSCQLQGMRNWQVRVRARRAELQKMRRWQVPIRFRAGGVRSLPCRSQSGEGGVLRLHPVLHRMLCRQRLQHELH
mmetsp:Transcript_44996/g.88529  ORF Transcript_44996/g.88529 Transcript_44996/m.88529 type:complete len:287 (+) Transcript_44996:520-1380(+)